MNRRNCFAIKPLQLLAAGNRANKISADFCCVCKCFFNKRLCEPILIPENSVVLLTRMPMTIIVRIDS